jgi:hypothetical protein
MTNKQQNGDHVSRMRKRAFADYGVCAWNRLEDQDGRVAFNMGWLWVFVAFRGDTRGDAVKDGAIGRKIGGRHGGGV